MIEASNDAAFCRKLVNYRRYPIDDVDHAARRAAIGRCCRSLEKDGCAVIKKFLSKEGLRLLLQEAVERKPKTYFSNSKTTTSISPATTSRFPEAIPGGFFSSAATVS
jgi:hypothetical protein